MSKQKHIQDQTILSIFARAVMVYEFHCHFCDNSSAYDTVGEAAAEGWSVIKEEDGILRLCCCRGCKYF